MRQTSPKKDSRRRNHCPSSSCSIPLRDVRRSERFLPDGAVTERMLMLRFFLINPTASREYAPLRELRTAIQQILECESGHQDNTSIPC